jgi:archaeal type IV pilus assembly protein PilA
MSTLRSFYRNTKALSPVVATILLVAIAVIASVLTYLWATGFIGAIQTRPNQATETVHVQAGSIFRSNGSFVIYVQNAGTTAVTFQQAFLLDTSGNALGTTTVLTFGITGCTANPCAQGTVAQLSGTINAVGSSTQVILQVVTKLGTSAEITLTPR